MKHADNVISFDVNEVLYFEKGQEIAEMLSISLEPEVSIQSYDHYIQVRGLILLQGEYIKAEENDTDKNEVQEVTGYIEKVIDTSESEAQFIHRFPVEISVPPNRVTNLEDVTVTIDSFDYELPEMGKLKIKSSVHINGIKSDELVEKEKQAIKTEQKNKETAKTKEDEIIPETIQATTKLQHKEEPIIQKETEQHTAQEGEEIEVIKEAVDQNVEDTEIDIQLNESKEEEEEEVKDVRFLTDLFGGDEEGFTKMRIYIAQEEDSIESIAKRYKISALQLIKDNHLSGENIEAGQLLHLPAKPAKIIEQQ